MEIKMNKNNKQNKYSPDHFFFVLFMGTAAKNSNHRFDFHIQSNKQFADISIFYTVYTFIEYMRYAI